MKAIGEEQANYRASCHRPCENLIDFLLLERAKETFFQLLNSN